MHIHANNNLMLASLGVVRNEIQEVQAKKAAEVRRKLAAPLSSLSGAGDGVSGVTTRDEEPREELWHQQSEAGQEVGRPFSAQA